jgi:hypothetical protein
MIALMMEAVRTSETSVDFHEILLLNIPEGCLLFSFFLSLLSAHQCLFLYLSSF